MRAKDPAVLARCQAILDELGITAEKELAAELMQTIAKLAEDGPGRADMLLLLRSFKELRYAIKTFKPYRHRRKVSIFGSARTPPDDPNYLLAEEFARQAAGAGFMIITGAGPGIMQAGNVGAGQANSFGVAIRLPFEQTANKAILGSEKLIHFRYFFSRKVVFVKETHAIALFPGGFGTHDEGFEVLTLVQTGRCDPLPIVLVERPGGTYWQEWDHFVRTELLAKGMISPEDTALYFIAHDAQAAVDHIVRFYSNYQSLRYVGEELVLRIRHAPTAVEMDRLNAQFADLMVPGDNGQRRLRIVAAADIEPGSPLPEIPRLVLRFNRRSLARLRMLIDALNALESLPPLPQTAPAAAEVGANEPDRGVSEIAEEEDMKIVP